jgi:hypothetical protein
MSWCPVLAVLSKFHVLDVCPDDIVMAVPPVICPGCPVLAVMFWPSCSLFSVLPIPSQLSCPDFPVLAVYPQLFFSQRFSENFVKIFAKMFGIFVIFASYLREKLFATEFRRFLTRQN